jgi:hypothetical protein
MTAAGGSDVVLLMVSGVAVVIITLRVMARAYRIKQQALKQQPAAKVAPRRSSSRPGVGVHSVFSMKECESVGLSGLRDVLEELDSGSSRHTKVLVSPLG